MVSTLGCATNCLISNVFLACPLLPALVGTLTLIAYPLPLHLASILYRALQKTHTTPRAVHSELTLHATIETPLASLHFDNDLRAIPTLLIIRRHCSTSSTRPHQLGDHTRHHIRFEGLKKTSHLVSSWMRLQRRQLKEPARFPTFLPPHDDILQMARVLRWLWRHAFTWHSEPSSTRSPDVAGVTLAPPFHTVPSHLERWPRLSAPVSLANMPYNSLLAFEHFAWSLPRRGLRRCEFFGARAFTCFCPGDIRQPPCIREAVDLSFKGQWCQFSSPPANGPVFVDAPHAQLHLLTA